jgi:hypothetical protein
MQRYTDEPLISLDLSMRQREQEKIKTQQQKKMDARRVARQSNTFDQSVAANTDHYMQNALTQVRKSSVTHNEDLMRLQGTWMWNMK